MVQYIRRSSGVPSVQPHLDRSHPWQVFGIDVLIQFKFLNLAVFLNFFRKGLGIFPRTEDAPCERA